MRDLSTLWTLKNGRLDESSKIVADFISVYLTNWNETASTEDAENVVMDLAYILDVKITVHKNDSIKKAEGGN